MVDKDRCHTGSGVGILWQQRWKQPGRYAVVFGEQHLPFKYRKIAHLQDIMACGDTLH
jgi:hypothetical protein